MFENYINYEHREDCSKQQAFIEFVGLLFRHYKLAVTIISLTLNYQTCFQAVAADKRLLSPKLTSIYSNQISTY